MTRLAWQRGGAFGGLPVVLVHSWGRDGPGDWEATGWAVALRRPGFAAYAPDLPGHGESADQAVPAGAEPAGWTAATILDDLDELQVDAFHAVGYGEGCVTAAHLAVRDPDRVPRLVLIGCDDHARMPFADEISAALRDRAARVWHTETADAVALVRGDRRHDPRALADWAERASWPAATRLGALRTPVLLAVGADDDRRDGAPRLAQLFHDGRLVTVPGGHRGMLTAPQLRDAVVSFLREPSGR